MSFKVLSEALDYSRAKGSDRCVLLALADAASHDGVTWLPILPTRARGPVKGQHVDERKCITHRANCSKSEALRSIKKLQELGEIEIRQAQRGQKRINVYRVVVGSIAESGVDYDRLPFDLNAPFGVDLQGVNLAPRTGAADGPDLAPRGVSSEHVRGAILAPHGVPVPRARVNDGSEPSEDPSENQPQHAAAAALLDRDLEQLGIGTALRLRALANLPLARAWCDLAAAEADSNPAGFFRAGFDSGEQPSPRARLESAEPETAGASRRRWIEQTSWQLEHDDAHAIVDGWTDVDHVERSMLHELVDSVRDQRSKSGRVSEAA
jgi:hypothetical protein